MIKKIYIYIYSITNNRINAKKEIFEFANRMTQVWGLLYKLFVPLKGTET